MTVRGGKVLADTFQVFHPQLREALQRREFLEPTQPQEIAIPPLLKGEHVLVIAPTGSGKTETAMLPVFHHILENNSQESFGIDTMYITPLRALNRDMQDRLEWWGETLDIDVDVRHGDTSQYQRQKQAESPPDVLVTTPETLQAMLTGKRLRTALSTVNHVIVDEVHELAGSKRGAQLAVGLERLLEVSEGFQRIGLSATVGAPDAVGEFLTGGRGCTIREVAVGSNLELTVQTPDPTKGDEQLAGELVTDASTASHVRYIANLVTANESTLIFVNTRQTAEALGSRFKAMGANIGVHHGSLAKAARIDVEEAFKDGELSGLICTSSMELGIDIGRIDHVIQYQSPREVTRLLQRVGRAGHRIGTASRGTIVATRFDDVFEAAAITAAAIEGDVEPARIHRGSLDTLANQIVGIVMDEGEISGAEVYEIISRTTPFAEVTPETVRAVIEQLSRNRIIWLNREDDRISKTGETWRYFYSNLSMIPDEATYTVYNMASGEQIGSLDERFVVNFAAPGEIFIQRGEMWRIVEIDEDRERVKVSPIEDPAGEVPSWIGQEIPVPYHVAQRVGYLREAVSTAIERDESVTAHVPDSIAGDGTIRTAIDPIERQLSAGHPIPTSDRWVIEYGDGSIVINACLGHRTNETLGRVLAALLGQQTGSTIGLDVDPYRIDLEIPSRLTPTDVESILQDTKPEHVETIIELSLKRSDALQFRLAQVATKFGALKNWDSKTSSRPPRRLLAALRDTPMYDEAVRELIHEELNIEQAARSLEAVQTGEITISTTWERTPIGLEGRTGIAELLAPENADASVIQTVKERLMSDRVILLCVHCTQWDRKTTVERVPDNPVCPHCGSTRIAALNPWDEDTLKAVRAEQKDEEQDKLTRRAHRAANLVQSHGKHAVIALAARGVGPHNAARIIGKLRADEDDFYRDLIEQEREYARTRSFWD